MKQPSATVFAIAGIYLCVVCQMFDHPLLWERELTAGGPQVVPI